MNSYEGRITDFVIRPFLLIHILFWIYEVALLTHLSNLSVLHKNDLCSESDSLVVIISDI